MSARRPTHPDDEVPGCGGTLARLAEEGADARILILGEGIASRQAKRDVRSVRRGLAALRRRIWS